MAKKAERIDLGFKDIGALGRVVIPAEVRALLKIASGTPVSMYIEDGRLILEPVTSEEAKTCVICNRASMPDQVLSTVVGMVCSRCVTRFAKDTVKLREPELEAANGNGNGATKERKVRAVQETVPTTSQKAKVLVPADEKTIGETVKVMKRNQVAETKVDRKQAKAEKAARVAAESPIVEEVISNPAPRRGRPPKAAAPTPAPAPAPTANLEEARRSRRAKAAV